MYRGNRCTGVINEPWIDWNMARIHGSYCCACAECVTLFKAAMP